MSNKTAKLTGPLTANSVTFSALHGVGNYAFKFPKILADFYKPVVGEIVTLEVFNVTGNKSIVAVAQVAKSGQINYATTKCPQRGEPVKDALRKWHKTTRYWDFYCNIRVTFNRETETEYDSSK